MHTNNENVKKWNDNAYKGLYEKYLSVIYEFMHVDRLDELVGVIDSFVGNKEFEKFFKQCEFSDDEPFDFDKKLIPIIHGLNKAISLFDHCPLYFPSITHKLIITRSFDSMFSVIQLGFVH